MSAPAGVVYSDAIRQRWRRPRFRGEIASATASAEDVNPLCGDRVRMMLSMDGPIIRAVRFVGDSCAICTASADVVAQLSEGRTAGEVRALGAGDVLAALQSDVRPTRMRCVTLPLSVIGQELAS